jgi:hypothetical protein
MAGSDTEAASSLRRAGPNRAQAARRRDGCPRGPPGRWQAPQRTQPCQPGVGDQVHRGGRGPRKRRRRRCAGRLVDQPCQHGQAAEAVGQHMVQDDHQRDRVAGKAGDQHRRPQRPRAWRRLGHHRGGQLQQGPLITRGRTVQVPQVAAEVEVGVIHPDGTATPWGTRTSGCRSRGTPLPGRPAAVGRRPGQSRVRRPAAAPPRPAGGPTGIHGQRGQVGWAGPLDHLPRPRAGPCRQPPRSVSRFRRSGGHSGTPLLGRFRLSRPAEVLECRGPAAAAPARACA